jgi:hypothetical protein
MRRPLTPDRRARIWHCADAVAGTQDLARGMTTAEFVASRRRRKSKRLTGVSTKDRNRYASELVSFMKARDWEARRGELHVGHLVALYCWCHGEVYRVQPSELDQAHEFAVAIVMAKRFADQQFRGDLVEVVKFIQWCWKREHRNENWRLQNGHQGRRLTWRIQFSAALVTDYRLDLARVSR